jgi:anti-sigma factor RsiW
VSDYLDLALTDAQRARVEAHLEWCGDCTRYVDQMRRTIVALGQLRPGPPDPATITVVLEAWRQSERR